MTADVVIVGGGLVGALAAVLLGAQGRKLVVVERTRPERQVGELGIDIRNVAVSPASQELLQTAQVWQQLDSAAYTRMCIWEERGTRQLEFAAATAERDELGWICEHSEVVRALWQRLVAMDNVELCVGDEIREISVSPDRVVVELASGQVAGSLLVGADGNQSRVRTALAVPVREKPTGHHALATVIRSARGHEGVAWQRFLLDGPLALLPSGDPHLTSVVWSQSPAQAERRVQQDAAAFCAELTACTEGCLGRVAAVDRRLVFPVAQMLVQSFNPAPRVLLIGDAAHAIHPLAGLGANVGFEDVRDLVAHTDGLAAHEDLGVPGLWETFARQRRARAKMMLALMTGLRRVYAATDPLTGLLRNTGVGWLDGSEAIKRQFIQEALGLGPLAQGFGPLAQSLGPLAQSLGSWVRRR